MLPRDGTVSRPGCGNIWAGWFAGPVTAGGLRARIWHNMWGGAGCRLSCNIRGGCGLRFPALLFIKQYSLKWSLSKAFLEAKLIIFTGYTSCTLCLSRGACVRACCRYAYDYIERNDY